MNYLRLPCLKAPALTHHDRALQARGVQEDLIGLKICPVQRKAPMHCFAAGHQHRAPCLAQFLSARAVLTMGTLSESGCWHCRNALLAPSMLALPMRTLCPGMLWI